MITKQVEPEDDESFIKVYFTDTRQTLKPLWYLHFATAGKTEKGF